MERDLATREPDAMTRTPQLSAALAATALSVTLLAGCAPSLPLPGGAGDLEEAIEQETGGQVDLGDAASVPADWPAELPRPEGRLITAVSVDGGHTLIYTIADESVGERLVAEVVALGFEEIGSSDLGDLVSHVLERDGWTVTIGWVLTDEIALTYASSAH